MAGTKEQQRIYQRAYRAMLRRLRDEQPDTYRAWLAEALDEIDAEAEGQHQ